MTDSPTPDEVERYPQWARCPQGGNHMARWTPLNDEADPRWYVLCRECNVEGYVIPPWSTDQFHSGESQS